MPAITITSQGSANVALRLIDILQANLAQTNYSVPAGTQNSNYKPMCGEVSFQADKGNSGNVIIGDAKVSATNGVKLPGGGSTSFGPSDLNDVGLLNKYILFDTLADKLSLQWEYR
jgi:hypothetical protein